jgi:hypothetical protein
MEQRAPSCPGPESTSHVLVGKFITNDGSTFLTGISKLKAVWS